MNDNGNIDIVRQIYRDFLTGDINAVLDALAEDVDWSGRVNWPGGPCVLPYEGKRRGRNAVAECFESLLNTVQYEGAAAATRYITTGNHVLAIGQDIRRIRATGELTENRWTMCWTLDGGKVIRIRIYQDTVEALD